MVGVGLGGAARSLTSAIGGVSDAIATETGALRLTAVMRAAVSVIWISRAALFNAWRCESLRNHGMRDERRARRAIASTIITSTIV